MTLFGENDYKKWEIKRKYTKRNWHFSLPEGWPWCVSVERERKQRWINGARQTARLCYGREHLGRVHATLWAVLPVWLIPGSKEPLCSCTISGPEKLWKAGEFSMQDESAIWNQKSCVWILVPLFISQGNSFYNPSVTVHIHRKVGRFSPGLL